MVNDIVLTKIPKDYQSLRKKRGNQGSIMKTLVDIPIGMAVEVSGYNIAKQYKSVLNREFPEKSYDYYSLNNKYYLGRIA